jgi:predicted RNase H-like HicB family nuclease
MIDPHTYNVTIRKGHFEGETCFEARVRELPDLAEYGDSYEEAYELAVDAIYTTAQVLEEKGALMPAPQDIPDDFSGRVTLRLPKTLHRGLSVAAECEGISLNQYLVNILSYYSGYAVGKSGADTFDWSPAPASKEGRIASRQPVHLACPDGDMNDGWKKAG